MGEHIEKLTARGWQVYPINSCLAFALSDKKIIMVTPLALYLVTNSQLNSQAGHARIRRGILSREYTSLADILTDMRLTPGVGVSYRMLYKWELERMYND